MLIRHAHTFGDSEGHFVGESLVEVSDHHRLAPVVTIALHGLADGHVQCRNRTATEFLMGHSHPSVENEDSRPSTCTSALVSADAVQTPGGCLHSIGLDLWNHVHRLIWLHIPDSAMAVVDDRLQILFGSTHLKEGHPTLLRGAHKIASILVGLAHGLDLFVARPWVDNHHPLLFFLALKLAQTGLSIVGAIIIEHWDASDELGRCRGC